MTDIVTRLNADADRWMAGDVGRDNEEAGLLSYEAANEITRLRDALKAYTEYCNICHGRGTFIEEDVVTGADFWRECHGCKTARDALKGQST